MGWCVSAPRYGGARAWNDRDREFFSTVPFTRPRRGFRLSRKNGVIEQEECIGKISRPAPWTAKADSKNVRMIPCAGKQGPTLDPRIHVQPRSGRWFTIRTISTKLPETSAADVARVGCRGTPRLLVGPTLASGLIGSFGSIVAINPRCGRRDR